MQIIIVHIVVKSGDPYKPGYGNKQNVFFKEQNPLKHKKNTLFYQNFKQLYCIGRFINKSIYVFLCSNVLWIINV